MNAKPTRTSRLDGLDAQRFETMMQSASFALLRERIEQVLKRERDGCESLIDETELRRAQGALAALRTVVGLPARILAEMRAKAPGGE